MRNATQRAATSLLGLAVVGSALACTATTTIEPRPGARVPSRACFNVDRVRSFTALHERFVYVRVRSDEHYLLTLDSLCMGLPVAAGISISAGFNRVCSDTFATLAYTNFGNRTTCRIVRVEAVASKEEAEELVKDRITPRPKG
jgi:hypothetical protein